MSVCRSRRNVRKIALEFFLDKRDKKNQENFVVADIFKIHSWNNAIFARLYISYETTRISHKQGFLSLVM
jgi:hypothetical protein